MWDVQQTTLSSEAPLRSLPQETVVQPMRPEFLNVFYVESTGSVSSAAASSAMED